jgi:hypothetical protein
VEVTVRHHHLRRELIIAIVLASVAGVTIVLAALYACIVWQRYRRAPDDFKDTQSTGLDLCLLDLATITEL